MALADDRWAPTSLRPLVDAVARRAAADRRVIGVLAVGSGATGTMDQYSDLDFVIVARDDGLADILREARLFAAQVGPLLSAFTGEHVREPGLLLCLYGPPLVRVDLKFVADRDLDRRVEDGKIIWQRDGCIDAAFVRVAADWPTLSPQWMEDRFWTWIFNGATKLGRGELFACLEELAFLRRVVLAPLIAQSRGHRASGVRRIEQIDPDLVPAMQSTVGEHSPDGCARALRAAIALYLQLRAEHPEVVVRQSAESAVVEYLKRIESHLSKSRQHAV